MSASYTYSQVVEILLGDGNSRADIDATLTSMSEAGFELPQPDGGLLINADELDLCREQLEPTQI